MKHIYILLIFSIVLFSCNNKCELYPNTILLNCIKSYIMRNETKLAIYDENNKSVYEIYYTLLFFEKDTMMYFTIWESFIPANFLNIQGEIDDSNNLYYNILNRDIYIFNCNKKAENMLFSFCNKKKLQKKEEKSIDMNSVPIYDGSLYPETYRYYQYNANIIIEKIDTILTRVR